jgi:hypothetical protein
VLYIRADIHFWSYLAHFFLEWEMFLDRSCRENQNTFCVQQLFFFRKSCRLWDNVEKYCTAGQATDVNRTRRMRIANWIPMATDTNTEYVRIILIAFPLRQWLRERFPVLYYSTMPVLFYNHISTAQNWTVSVTLQPHCPAEIDSGIRWIRCPVGLQPVVKRNTCIAFGNLILSSP